MQGNIKIKKIGDEYFYKATNIFKEDFLLELYESSVFWLDNTRQNISLLTEKDKEPYPPEASGRLLEFDDHIKDKLWIKYYGQIKLHIANYCKISNINISNIKIKSSWITRVFDNEFDNHSKEYLRSLRKQFNPFNNMHSHKNNPVGVVFYLKNPNPKWGTLIKITDTEFINNSGEENSIFIFNTKIKHSGIYPPDEELQTVPRIALVTDCIYNL